MKITRKSPLTGDLNIRYIAVNQSHLDRIATGKEFIRDICPHLSADDREFLKTGFTPEDWEVLFKEEA